MKTSPSSFAVTSWMTVAAAKKGSRSRALNLHLTQAEAKRARLVSATMGGIAGVSFAFSGSGRCREFPASPGREEAGLITSTSIDSQGRRSFSRAARVERRSGR